MTGKFVKLLGFVVVLLVSSGDAGQLRVLNGNISMVYVTDTLGGTPFMIFYDRFLTNKDHYTTVKLKDSTSEAQCRLYAIAQNYKFCSMAPKSDGTIDCRISNKNMDENLVLQFKSGAVTFVQEEQKQFWPHDDGIFYKIGRKANERENYDTTKKSCPASKTKQLPIPKGKQARMDVFKMIAAGNYKELVLMGAKKKDDDTWYKWYDGDKTHKVEYEETDEDTSLMLHTDGSYLARSTQAKVDTVCMLNLFEITW